LVRSKSYGVLLVLGAVIGVLVSLAAWGFLELIHYMQQMGVRGSFERARLCPGRACCRAF
jgi:hypothetical protein